ncbi:hypothetical protein B0H13DRAFT_2453123 [Mycena leptocephala]|nr:hypothetical protein B0H13DRAFT_2453123 [Mycena leptocephala]
MRTAYLQFEDTSSRKGGVVRMKGLMNRNPRSEQIHKVLCMLDCTAQIRDQGMCAWLEDRSAAPGASVCNLAERSIPTPGSESVPAPALKTPVPTPAAPADAYGGTHGGGGIQGSAALNSSRFEDNVPTGDFTPRIEGSAALNSSRFEDNVPTGDFTPRVEGSAALNSSRLQDNVPTGDMLVSPNRSEEADDDASSGSNSENVVDADASADADGDGTKKSKKTKKPKLMQRLKERMHIGGSA